jgi:hypothetical protein
MNIQSSPPTQTNYPPAFDRAVARLLGDEGGYVDKPAAPGGFFMFLDSLDTPIRLGDTTKPLSAVDSIWTSAVS